MKRTYQRRFREECWWWPLLHMNHAVPITIVGRGKRTHLHRHRSHRPSQNPRLPFFLNPFLRALFPWGSPKNKNETRLSLVRVKYHLGIILSDLWSFHYLYTFFRSIRSPGGTKGSKGRSPQVKNRMALRPRVWAIKAQQLAALDK